MGNGSVVEIACFGNPSPGPSRSTSIRSQLPFSWLEAIVFYGLCYKLCILFLNTTFDVFVEAL